LDVAESFDEMQTRLARERVESRKAQKEGNQMRKAAIDYFLEVLTSPACPLTNEDFDHFKMIGGIFGEPLEIVNRIDAGYSDRPEVRKALLLSVVVHALNRLLTDPKPEQPKISATEELARRLAVVPKVGESAAKKKPVRRTKKVG
jgi:hypothetical protein